MFQIRVAEVLNGRINGTPDWYATIAKKFQYNSVTETGDELIFNEDTMKIEYATVDTSHRIIERAAWQTDGSSGELTLKICKANSNSNEVNNGIPYMQLNDNELTAFRMFIQQIKFVGAKIVCKSLPGDIITIIADKENPIFYNDSYVTKSQALSELQQAMIDFANEITFNGMLYYQSILDAVRKTEHITDIGNRIRIYISSYDMEEREYKEPVELTNRIRLKSGYVRFLDADSIMTVNEDNLTLVPASRMDEYFDALNL